jgi:protein-tyrosine-phosphatase
MAMALWRAKVSQSPEEWRIESAGVWAPSGYPAAPNALKALEKRSLDLSGHLSRPVDRSLVSGFNLILTMERGQKEALRAAFTEIAPRVFLLSEMVGETADIVDPIGRPLSHFEHTAAEIDDILSQGYEKILKLSTDETHADAAA